MPWDFPEYPLDWKDIAHEIRIRDGFRCRNCGSGEPPLHVHHIIPISKGGTSDPSNLETLCEYCHSLQHRHMAGRVEYKPDLPETEYVEFSKEIDIYYKTVHRRVKRKYSSEFKPLEEQRMGCEEQLNFFHEALNTYSSSLKEYWYQIGYSLAFILLCGFVAYFFLLRNILIQPEIITIAIVSLSSFPLYFKYKPKISMCKEKIKKYNGIKNEYEKEYERIEKQIEVLNSKVTKEVEKRKREKLRETTKELKKQDKSRFCKKCGSLMYHSGKSKINGYILLKCKKCGSIKEVIIEA